MSNETDEQEIAISGGLITNNIKRLVTGPQHVI